MPEFDGRLTWLGHSTFCLDTAEGKRILLEAFTKSCPTCPSEWQQPDNIDAILVTHGHGDHVGDVADLAAGGAQVACQVELAHWIARNGVPQEQVIEFNKGGTIELAGTRVTMVHAQHSNSAPDGSYAGEAAGFIIELGTGYRIYHAGDTNCFGDMRLIGELYAPDLALLPIGDHYTMSPREAAKAVELLDVRDVIGMHWGTFPPLVGRPAQVAELVGSRATVHALQPGEALGALTTA